MRKRDTNQHHFSETPVFVGCGVRVVGTNETNMTNERNIQNYDNRCDSSWCWYLGMHGGEAAGGGCMRWCTGWSLVGGCCRRWGSVRVNCMAWLVK